MVYVWVKMKIKHKTMNFFKLIIRYFKAKTLVAISKKYSKLVEDFKENQTIINNILTNYDVQKVDDTKTQLTIISPEFDYYKVVHGADFQETLQKPIKKEEIPNGTPITKVVNPLQMVDEIYYEIETNEVIYYDVHDGKFDIIDKDQKINFDTTLRVFDSVNDMNEYYKNNQLESGVHEYVKLTINHIKYYKPIKKYVHFITNFENIPDDEKNNITLVDSLDNINKVGYYKLFKNKEN